jgi:hypothetical protein
MPLSGDPPPNADRPGDVVRKLLGDTLCRYDGVLNVGIPIWDQDAGKLNAPSAQARSPDSSRTVSTKVTLFMLPPSIRYIGTVGIRADKPMQGF